MSGPRSTGRWALRRTCRSSTPGTRCPHSPRPRSSGTRCGSRLQGSHVSRSCTTGPRSGAWSLAPQGRCTRGPREAGSTSPGRRCSCTATCRRICTAHGSHRPSNRACRACRSRPNSTAQTAATRGSGTPRGGKARRRRRPRKSGSAPTRCPHCNPSCPTCRMGPSSSPGTPARCRTRTCPSPSQGPLPRPARARAQRRRG
mmetsp:Transcript_117922/g.340880  ORF Transcript_117922/g.340880 Transcript_117922/m.340880 type:complete len:201 (-) Transcript_117922:14-616(-)